MWMMNMARSLTSCEKTLHFLPLLKLELKALTVHFFLSSFKVSWMRKRDLHILTSNNFLYTGDQRFSVIHPQDSDEWNLKIEYAQPKDAGTYECQVSARLSANPQIPNLAPKWRIY